MHIEIQRGDAGQRCLLLERCMRAVGGRWAEIAAAAALREGGRVDDLVVERFALVVYRRVLRDARL